MPVRSTAWNLSFSLVTFATFATAVIASCARSSSAPSDASGLDRSTTWGGEHLELVVSDTGAILQYDCAHGTIEGPLTIDDEGKFNLTGSHVRERGGPTRQGEAKPGHPTQYTGWTDGKKMTLAVRLVNTNEEMGTFELTRGQQARLFKCK